MKHIFPEDQVELRLLLNATRVKFSVMLLALTNNLSLALHLILLNIADELEEPF